MGFNKFKSFTRNKWAKFKKFAADNPNIIKTGAKLAGQGARALAFATGHPALAHAIGVGANALANITDNKNIHKFAKHAMSDEDRNKYYKKKAVGNTNSNYYVMDGKGIKSVAMNRTRSSYE